MSAEFEETVLRELKNINEKLDRHDKKFDAIDKKFDSVDKKIDAVNQKVDTQFDLIGAKFDEVDGKLDKITSVLEGLCHSVALINDIWYSSIVWWLFYAAQSFRKSKKRIISFNQ